MPTPGTHVCKQIASSSQPRFMQYSMQDTSPSSSLIVKVPVNLKLCRHQLSASCMLIGKANLIAHRASDNAEHQKAIRLDARELFEHMLH